MRTEEDLLFKLEEWLSRQPELPTVFDVCATGDGELLAAFVLKAARQATRDAVLKRIAHEAATTFDGDETDLGPSLFRVWDGLSRAWSLSNIEQASLLGLETPDDLRRLRTRPLPRLPTQIIERVAILLDIFKALNILLPRDDAADTWIRTPNRAPGFGGLPALHVMTTKGLPGLRAVRTYLQNNLH